MSVSRPAPQIPSHEADWRQRAACADPEVDPELFFPTSEWDHASINAAKAICVFCPVRGECLNDALRRGLDDGVFGGMTPVERRLLRLQEVA